MNDLLREHAPISTQGWKEIDAEATRTLKTLLAARRLVDFEGPLGWAASSVPTGRVEKLSPPLQEGAVTRLRGSLPLTELRVPFEIARDELEAIGEEVRRRTGDLMATGAISGSERGSEGSLVELWGGERFLDDGYEVALQIQSFERNVGPITTAVAVR